MNNQAKVCDYTERRHSLTDMSTISGEFRAADAENHLKCLFWDGMHERTSTGTVELEAAFGGGSLYFPHNIDSQLGTGRIRVQRSALDLKRPDYPRPSRNTSEHSFAVIKQDVRGMS
jgi:hypothetical protein